MDVVHKDTSDNSEERPFYNFLAEGYNNRAHEDVVKCKREKMNTLRDKGLKSIREPNYATACTVFYKILQWIENDEHPDEFQLKAEEVLCYKFCFIYCYSQNISLAEDSNNSITQLSLKINGELLGKHSELFFTTYLQLLLNYRKKQWGMCLYFCVNLLGHEPNVERETTLKGVDFFNADLIPEINFDNCISKVKIYERACLYGYFNYYSSKGAASEDDVKGMIEFQKEVHEIRPLDASFKMYQPKENTISIVSRKVDHVKTPKTNSSCAKESTNHSKSETSLKEPSGNIKVDELQLPDTEIVVNTENKSNQTEVSDKKSQSSQTQTVKHKHKEVQVVDQTEKKVLNSIKHMESSCIRALSEKDDVIKQLHKEIHQLNLKLDREEKYRRQSENKHVKTIEYYADEIHKLRSTIDDDEKKLRAVEQKNILLEKLMINLATDKFNLLKSICKDLKNKAAYLSARYRTFTKSLPPTCALSRDQCNSHSEASAMVLSSLKQYEDALNRHFENIRWEQLQVNNPQFTNWPLMPDVSLPEFNIYEEFKRLLDSLTELTNVNCELRRKLYRSRSSSILHTSLNGQQSQGLPIAAGTSGTQQNINSAAVAGTSGNSSNTSSPSQKTNKNPDDEELFDYILRNCSNTPEDEIIKGLFDVSKKYNGTFMNASKETVLREVKQKIQENCRLRDDKEEMSHVNWEDDIEQCSICLDVLSENNMQRLSCRHEFHRHCIGTWLTRNRVCPICRVQVH